MTKKAVSIFLLVMFSFQIFMVNASSEEITNPRTYNLELARWHIYNDGTHPIETTTGINKALQWSHEQGYQVFKVPAGTYLISKGTSPNDSQAQINMVSQMTFLLNDAAVIQKESNGFENYRTFYVGYGVNNATIKGGTLKGDKDTHNYSKKDNSSSYGTHEFGSGISSEGAYQLTIDGVRTTHFTGDGISINGSIVGIEGTYGKSYLKGDIDPLGKFIPSTSKIRSKTAVDLTNPLFKGRAYFAYEQPQAVSSNLYDVYFYNKDGKYVSAVKQIRFGIDLVQIPTNASSFYPVFSSTDLANFFVKLFSNDVSRNVTIKNSESAFNRRQGISLVGVDGIEITNNKIHDIQGTAPQYGIDSEAGGFFPNKNITINNNHFHNNKGGDIVFADGDTATISNNLFESNINVYIYKAFPNTVVKNNTFHQGGLTMAGTGVADQNTFHNAEVNLLATSNTLTNSTFVNSNLNLNNTDPFGSKVDQITMTNTDTSVSTSLNVGNRPVRLSNVTIKGLTKLSAIGGKGTDQNIYDQVVVQDYNAYNGTTLPAGTYNKCKFTSTTNESIGLGINQAGKYIFNDCSFHSLGKIFTINEMYGEPDVIFNNADFKISNDVGYAAAIYIQGVKQLSILGSIFNATNLTATKTPLIKVGSIAGATKPSKVKGFTIKNSQIITNKPLHGIDTTDAGTGAPAYTIAYNTLQVAIMKLKTNDMKTSNKELAN
ncbi:right-handed parallel beta-helix repeat-containing protein [Paenibacillus sp. HWE-109]|uniref:right-handed parallel beta-helix repeat-containing protein n=1 Tax=Paenibacillus sp. HWE-109 TaxID=1306526 RepID=UPI001EDEDB33|nr:right-handed parallel beta-helix repeat-containing protein [Paenibacillus sp. HWE-109]UKS29322.1 right-handed parallel beta-helix repeat-containing protein [Paenibacillus sp. HWE-109]